MNAWTTQEDGSVLGVATPRSIEWCDIQEKRLSALAQIGFVGWCRDMRLDPEWSPDTPAEVLLPEFGMVTTLLDQTTLSQNWDEFRVGAVEKDKWYAVVRIMPTATNVVLHILGLSAVLTSLVPNEGGGIPRSQLLSCPEFLRAFAHYQTEGKNDDPNS